jgi:hypothetical protein
LHTLADAPAALLSAGEDGDCTGGFHCASFAERDESAANA